ncbi:MAG TPA: hypothetical protein VFA57_17280 [Pseudolabrys sp.]|nr:hypothetical protein [Pseudolabrys sp.]
MSLLLALLRTLLAGAANFLALGGTLAFRRVAQCAILAAPLQAFRALLRAGRLRLRGIELWRSVLRLPLHRVLMAPRGALLVLDGSLVPLD